MKIEISHNEIYERLLIVEQEVHSLKAETRSLVDAFHAAQGAFVALEWLAKVVKPIIYLGSIFAGIVVWWNHE